MAQVDNQRPPFGGYTGARSVVKIAAMSSLYRSELSAPITPPMLGLAAAIVAAFTALSMVVAPAMDRTAGRAAESHAAVFAIAVAAQKEASALLGRTSPWWHYVVAAIGGFTFGVLLARAIAWLLG